MGRQHKVPAELQERDSVSTGWTVFLRKKMPQVVFDWDIPTQSHLLENKEFQLSYKQVKKAKRNHSIIQKLWIWTGEEPLRKEIGLEVRARVMLTLDRNSISWPLWLWIVFWFFFFLKKSYLKFFKCESERKKRRLNCLCDPTDTYSLSVYLPLRLKILSFCTLQASKFKKNSLLRLLKQMKEYKLMILFNKTVR